MANIKSAKKRILTSNKKAEANKAVKTGVKTAVKKVNAAVESGDKAAAQEALKASIQGCSAQEQRCPQGFPAFREGQQARISFCRR